MVRLQLLGGFRIVSTSGREITIRSTKQKAMLAYVAMQVGGAVQREKLADLMWGDSSEESSRHSLRQALFSLRSSLSQGGADSVLVQSSDGISLGRDVETDVAVLERHAAGRGADDLRAVVGCYSGALLDGIVMKGDDFNYWLNVERERLRGMSFEAARRLVAVEEERGDRRAALAAARRATAIDPLNESGHRLLMRLLAESGDRTAAVRQFQQSVEVLKRELGIEPEPETVRLFRAIQQGPSTMAARSGGTPLPVESELGGVRTTVGLFPFVPLDDGQVTRLAAAGLTQDVLVVLGKLPDIAVVDERAGPAGLVLPTGEPWRDAGGEDRPSDVDFTLSGTIQSLGDRLRVHVKLVETASRQTLWGERFDRRGDDLLSVQDEVAAEIAVALHVQLAHGDQALAWRRATHSLDAWLLQIRAVALLRNLQRDNLARSRQLSEEALAIDPDFASAWAHVGWTRLAALRSGWNDDGMAALDLISDAADRALTIDPTNPDAYMVKGAAMLVSGDFDAAIDIRRRGIAGNPSHADLRACMSATLHFAGENDEALHQAAIGTRLCPRGPSWAPIAQALVMRQEGDLDHAYDILRRLHSKMPTNMIVHALFTLASEELGLSEETRDLVRRFRRTHGRLDEVGLRLWLNYRDPEQAKELMGRLRITLG